MTDQQPPEPWGQNTLAFKHERARAAERIVRLSYSVNRNRRLVRSPRTYWCDPGLALHLAGEAAPGGGLPAASIWLA